MRRILVSRSSFTAVCLAFVVITLVTFQVLNEETLGQEVEDTSYSELSSEDYEPDEETDTSHQISQSVQEEEPTDKSLNNPGDPAKEKPVNNPHEPPIILWWTPFTHEKWKLKTCGKPSERCYITEDRHYLDDPRLKVLIFYGTDFPIGDLPLPRRSTHQWALLHEESPKNVYLFSHPEIMDLFNHTSTFKRESDYPIPLQFLKSVRSIESTKYMVSTEQKNKLLSKFALFNYVQSDCNAPSDRDHFVKMLQRRLQVDSYGECLHNKDLPDPLKDPLTNMLKADFLKYLAQYKFTIAMENAVCDDYMTEKMWRPFITGSVPILFGSPKAKEFLPAEKSAIFVEDFKTIDDLVEHILHLNNSDKDYDEYLEFKRTGVQNKKLKQILNARDWSADSTITQGKFYHFVEGFECFICRRLHENIRREKRGKPPLTFTAKVNHYGCPKPKKFSDNPTGSLERIDDPFIAEEWTHSQYEAQVLRDYIAEGKQISFQRLFRVASQLRRTENRSGL